MSDPLAPIRAEVMAHPPGARVEYALDILAYYLDPLPDFYAQAAIALPDLKYREIRAFYCLWQARGRVVTLNRLTAALSLGLPPDEWPLPEQARKVIPRLRARIGAAGLPISITSISGAGYVLTAPEGFDIGGPRI